jgi:hypothetical protein
LYILIFTSLTADGKTKCSELNSTKHTYIHTYRQTDRQTDRQTAFHKSLFRTYSAENV